MGNVVDSGRGSDVEAIASLNVSPSTSHSQLQCPYVVQLLGARVDRCQQVCALVCEKMARGCLYLLLHVHKTSMEWGQRLRIVRDICSGMAFIHSHQILHRNLLPQNILVSHTHHLHVGMRVYETVVKYVLYIQISPRQVFCLSVHSVAYMYMYMYNLVGTLVHSVLVYIWVYY